MMAGLATSRGTVERAAMHLGLPAPGLTAAQRTMPIVHRIGFAGVLAGAFLGCSLGMANLLLVDTQRSEILKLHALTKDQEIAFEVEASNRDRTDDTTIRVKGPGVDGFLASMTAALRPRDTVWLNCTPRPGTMPKAYFRRASTRICSLSALVDQRRGCPLIIWMNLPTPF
mmetsp:Transcript_1931/g.5594  ORF Transcript_1931/g.5594 Transcript_1931/m.5594 type:complete len:171 (+) Transcript_1931:231-743(+)